MTIVILKLGGQPREGAAQPPIVAGGIVDDIVQRIHAPADNQQNSETLQPVSSTEHRGSSPRPWQIAAIVALGVLARMAAMYLSPDSLNHDPDSYRLYAQSLLDEGGFFRNGQPSAWRAPLYPLLLAGCLSLPGTAWWWIAALHVVLGAATIWLTLSIARSWNLGRLSLVAGAIVALDPLLVHQSTQVMTETLATFTATLALWGATRWFERGTPAWGVMCGMALGASALARPALLVWALLVVGWALWCFRTRQPWRKISIIVVGLAIALAPWIVRNTIVLHRAVLTTTHGGFTLLLGNNPQFYDFLKTRKTGSTWNSRPFVEEWQQQLQTDGISSEIEENRLAYQLARRHMRQAPGDFLRAVLYRQASFWRLAPLTGEPSDQLAGRIARLAITFWNFGVLALALFGLLSLDKAPANSTGELTWDRAARVSLIAGLLLVVSLAAVHLVFWTDMRMRAPIVPVLGLLAAIGWGWMANRRGRKRKPAQHVTPISQRVNAP